MNLISKSDFRKLVFQKRRKYSLLLWKENSLKICQKIRSLKDWLISQNIGFYSAIDKEVNLEELIGEAFLKNKRVFLPKTWFKEKRLSFHQIFSLSDLKPGAFKILEPPLSAPLIEVSQLDLIFVPGVAFDLYKGRLGYGVGFYDRVLAQTKALKVGVAFSFQIFERLPLEEHDQRVDLVVTEEGVF
ncbi:MAG: 5-formyltetrahydrofolate cyclo-ligase [Thermodesulfobacteriaceae bacterium]|nr:5-formyltetrahydrofolate cyclo-ligase [Thermodesulfobacteriaceae bacterium]MCX8041890.1 5-formyltetrahydrofolate cyclo-ligase [Thermodesulfobacteriaceae bacterium]MDW8135372.1 5-formyltetrahydrofolate cyclo-ligase [Thermodesulfobacterium sp.]